LKWSKSEEVIMTAPTPAAMPSAARLQELLDRQDILDCIHRYCRAVDRFDRDLLLSVYHPDAIDDHGMFVGGPTAFADWAFGYHSLYQNLTHHSVTNHSCELAGDTAHCETYWFFSGSNKDPQTGRELPPSLHFGRYIDRFERRNGRWAIAARACIIEWHAALGEFSMPAEAAAAGAATGVGRRDRSDLSYQRPLTIKRQPTG
jgi:ketosteroid isomerase-like protein